ncbi:MAG: ATP-binding protein [Calditrichaeota bacterium]|nr:MAG: ATP-binding protein [Calditrichota bacterium]MBL1204707.1 ATP-binding protein [Calditrichota bacterium]NOG44535.1 ATP-binding protein [Calditrichota bacterium]
MANISKTISFPSIIDNLEKIEQMSSKIALDIGFDESTVDDISIALTELVNNAIHHANKDNPDKKVTVSFKSDDEKLTISILDEGEGFSPTNIGNPLDPDNLMSDSGRGLYLVEALMDSVEYKISKTGTEAIITKNLESK